MSSLLVTVNNLHVSEVAGGIERGVCLQFESVGQPAQLTEEEVGYLVGALTVWVNGLRLERWKESMRIRARELGFEGKLGFDAGVEIEE